MRIVLAIVLVIATLSSSAFAQPLAERVPPDALIYIGWAGSTQLGPDYDGSHLKAVLASSGVRALVDQTVGDLIGKVPGGSERDALRAVYAALGEALKYPTAVYLTGINPDAERDEAPFDAAIICRAGDNAMAIGQHILPMIAEAKEHGAPLDLRNAGDLLVLTIGKPTMPIGENADAPGFVAKPQFKSAMQRTGVKAPIVVAHVALSEVWSMIDRIAQSHGSERDQQQWRNVRQSLALDGLQAIAMAGGFDGPNWISAMHIAAPGPRKGLAAMLEPASPIAESTYKLIPATAAIAGVENLDAAALFDTIREMAGQFDPQIQQKMDQVVGQIQQQMGFHVRDDLLASLGTEWAYYTDAGVGGTGLLGGVLVNPLRDAKKAEQAMSQVLMMGQALLGQMPQRNGMRISIRPSQTDDARLYHLTTPLISPTFAFHGGRLYIGLVPHSVVGAMNQHKAGGKSILDNPKFAELRRRAGGGGTFAFSYVDVEQNLATTYPLLAMGDRFVSGAIEMGGLRGPMMILPPLDTLRAHVSPTGSFQWADEHGYYAQSRMPFPGASLLGMGQDMNLSVGGAALSAGILLPALGRAREVAQRAASAANLRGMFMAIYTYSVTNDDQFPDNMAVLVEDGSIGAKSLFHPASGKKVPAKVQREGLAAMARWASENSDYVYLGGLDANVPGDQIVMYEKTGNKWTREGLNAVFGDGHVEWMPRDEAIGTFKKLGMEDPYKQKAKRGEAVRPLE
jgi:prepilin-type processing-associated H-X9-DG protein